MNTVPSAFNAGLATIQSGQQRVNQAAQGIASTAIASPSPENTAQAASTPQAPVSDSLIELRAGQYQAQAGARLLDTADEVLGTLIDTRA